MWKEKTMHILQCQARGNPKPQLQCLQEGSKFKVPVGIPFLVLLNHSGTYSCQAASSRGTDKMLVMMDVQGEPRQGVIYPRRASLGGAETSVFILRFSAQVGTRSLSTSSWEC